MKNKILPILLHLLAITIVCTSACYANQENDIAIKQIFQKSPKTLSIAKRLSWFSEQFLGQPYQLGPLGEGKNGRYDQSPLYNLNGFDCTTYVETVLALAQSNTLSTFKKNLIAIRYKDNTPSYLSRNHFMSLDWIPNNIQKGFVKDISCKIKNEQNKSICQSATADIDKGAWLLKKTITDIKIQNNNQKNNRIIELKTKAKNYASQQARINYIPLTALFSHNKADLFLFNQIPNGSIITIVRPNWQLKQYIGTNINVSHLGFAIKKNGLLYFREASTIDRKVIDVPLEKYLKQYLESPSIKGINVLKIIYRKK